MTFAGRPKLTAREVCEQHAMEVDVLDAKGRTRLRRLLDIDYAEGIRAEDAGISDIARGVSAKARVNYEDRTIGKPVTPVDMTTTIVHKSAEESAASILEMLGQKRKESGQAQQPSRPQTIQ